MVFRSTRPLQISSAAERNRTSCLTLTKGAFTHMNFNGVLLFYNLFFPS